MQEVYKFLKECGTYYLATAENGQPRVRPFGTVDIFDGALCFQTGKSKEVSRQIHENPKIEICCFKDGTWLRLAATAVEDPRVEAQEHMLQAYPELRAMYQPGDGNTEIFRLKDAEAVFCSFTQPAKTVKFG
ncbi:MAG: pyridoxamine 5'-phosphate oxidase family protein [Clostridia bacterium]|nr:pyridoxamine 5'-phosphate oxidase family protein [Clostridia bacterium]